MQAQKQYQHISIFSGAGRHAHESGKRMNLSDGQEGATQAQALLPHGTAPPLAPPGTSRSSPECKFVRVPTSGMTLAYEAYGDASGAVP